MAISLRTVLFIAVIIFSLLTYSIYLYSKSNYTLPALFNVKVPLSNGTQIQTNAKDGSPAGANAGQAQETSNHGFIDAFIASISMIVVSELGDKTFFIAAIMAMRHARLVVYAGAMSALAAMTILSAMLGHVVTKFIPRIYTYYLSSILFAWFGLKMLKDGYAMSPNEGAEEYEEAQQEVEKAEANDDLEAGGGGGQLNDGSAKETQQRRVPTRSIGATITAWIRRYISPIFVQALIMTFLAEWGDRSQLATIVLAAGKNLLGVIIGGTLGHGICTGLAVMGGRFIAEAISPKTVTLIGGVVFLCFALSAIFIHHEA